jgi:hypothetical protein
MVSGVRGGFEETKLGFGKEAKERKPWKKK